MGVSTLSDEEFSALVSGLHRASIADEDEFVATQLDELAPWLPASDARRVVAAVLDRRTGLGEIEVLLADDTVTDVLVDGPGAVVVERAGQLVESGIVLDAEGVRLLVDRVARHCRPRPERLRPIAHGVLPSGTRVTVVLSPTARPGPAVAFRRHRPTGWTLEQLAGEFADRLRTAVDRRESIVVAGATGSGKTSLVAALLASAARERLVVVEDVAELPATEGALHLEADERTDFRELVAASLRLRPDRIVVGEVRGAEAVDVLHALTSGHRGAMTTVHASDGASALRRLVLLSGQADDRVDAGLVAEHWRAAIDLVVVMQRHADGSRRVASVWECD